MDEFFWLFIIGIGLDFVWIDLLHRCPVFCYFGNVFPSHLFLSIASSLFIIDCNIFLFKI